MLATAMLTVRKSGVVLIFLFRHTIKITKMFPINDTTVHAAIEYSVCATNVSKFDVALPVSFLADAFCQLVVISFCCFSAERVFRW